LLPSLAFSRDDRNAGKAGRFCQAGRKLLLDGIPPPLRAKENWSTGLRSSRRRDPLAKWTRERWTETLEKDVALLHLKALFLI
jgi:hypothetical protein